MPERLPPAARSVPSPRPFTTETSHQGLYHLIRSEGSLDPRTDVLLNAARAALQERPTGLIHDLTAVDDHASVAEVCMALADEALIWPGTPTVLLTTIELAKILVAAGVDERLPIAHTVDAAGAALRTDTNWRRTALSLPPSLDVPRQVRQFVEDRVSRWRLGALSANATLIANELVTNAVVHAGTFLDIRLSNHNQFLAVSVADRSDRSVRPAQPSGDDEAGRGLMLVAALAFRWGETSTPGSGKTVWAVLHPQGGAAA